jgi:hypothetical protein
MRLRVSQFSATIIAEMRAPAQTSLAFKTWGGARAGAGRKPSRDSGQPHLARPELSRHHPVHTTLRVAHGCWNLRSRRALAALQGASKADAIDSVSASFITLCKEITCT